MSAAQVARGTYERIRGVVSRIPRGRVATYGQIARLAGMPGHARLVGYAMSALPDRSTVPWHRVVNARGLVSERAEGSGGHDALQRVILRREGVRFDRRGAIPLEEFQWRPRGATPAAGRTRRPSRRKSGLGPDDAATSKRFRSTTS